MPPSFPRCPQENFNTAPRPLPRGAQRAWFYEWASEPRPPHQVKAVTGSLALGPIQKTRHTSTQFPAFPIHENSFGCAPTPTPNARPASNAGPSPQRFRKKAQCFIHKKGKEKKAAGSNKPTKETRFIHKVTHIHKNELQRRALPTVPNSSCPSKPPTSSPWHLSSTRSSVPPRSPLL